MPSEEVHPTAEVDERARVGAGTRVWHHAQVLGDARLGAGCTLGKGAFVGAGSTLGDRVKVGNGANIFGAQVDDGAFIGPTACLLEDPAPRAVTPEGDRVGPADWEGRPVRVGAGASIGAGALVLPGVVVGRWAMVGAGAVVHRDVERHALVTGNPARQVGWVCACGQRLDEQLRCPCGRGFEEADDGLVERSP